jgi:signal transduction histidine kinase/HAMP domain-containing protein/ActR/RegA family two-component response regulator
MTETTIKTRKSPSKPKPQLTRAADAARPTANVDRDVRMRRIVAAMLGLRDGDYAVRLPPNWNGVEGQIAATFNQIASLEDRLRHEIDRLSRTIGREGRLSERMSVPGALGGWAAKVDAFNSLLDDLARPTAEISRAIGAVAKGDLGQSLDLELEGRPLKGEFLRSAKLVNAMIGQLAVFTSEVTRVAQEVGNEGKLGGQAEVKGVSGVWKELTDSVNQMAGNLTAQVRNIADVTIAVADGDLSKKITVDVRGEILLLKEAINTMVDQLRSFAAEVTRVAREVGTDGRLGGQAVVPGVAGTWKDLTDSVNAMATNLTTQVRNIAQVTTAVARGDLSRKITVDVSGEILELKETINTMVDQLNGFASEVTRVSREVGTEGKLGGQAAVPGAAGTWKDLTDSVNFMASNLTDQVRNIAEVTTAVAKGDLSRKITVDVKGEILALKNTINTMVDQLNSFASEVTRVAREVGTEGRLGVQAYVPGVAGTWKDLTDSVNVMGGNLTAQVRNIAEVTTAVARGDLNRKIMVDVKGEILELKNTVNTMVDQLNAFASEVSRVAREVGTEGKLGGQAQVAGVAGTWKDLTDNVNLMASNLTEQVRGIVKVVTAVANGNLSQRLTMQAKGEVAALADTINNMTDTLATFADQVTNVAREVGVEGRLGGQANVPGAAGTWKDLTGNVNLLAANLTSQVRAIAEVATAVTKGDHTRSIDVETRGEVAALKDNINTMISNLRETTEHNHEQDWLKTNLARFAGLLQGQRELNTVGRMLLSELSPLVRAHQGTIYRLAATREGPELRLLSSYARTRHPVPVVPLGEGLVGQCAIEKKRVLLNDVPPEFVGISSSLGDAPRMSIVILPVLFEGETKAVIELATLHRFTEVNLALLDQLMVSLGPVFNTIEATMRTEGLLEESQRLTAQLQFRQTELQQTNEELGSKAKLLAEQNAEVERKNVEVEHAGVALQEKAAELALTSKYKSQFLANMSHELRTPLNSILVLSQQLAENPSGSLSDKQVEFSRVINSSGADLLHLIDDILDLSKIESGTVTLQIEQVPFARLRDNLDRTFRHVAEAKNVPLKLELADGLPESIECDPKRLEQIIKNLLSNAVKFTSQGHVDLNIYIATEGWSAHHPVLSKAPKVVAFAVEDTGIGIAAERQKLIWEVFQQEDAGTARKYGGTGLGLAISRELARLLNGEITLASVLGQGSTFALYLPLHHGAREATGSDEQSGGSPTSSTEHNVSVVPGVQGGGNVLSSLSGRKVLVVDDDARNIFALTSLLENHGMDIITATSGRAAIEIVGQTADLSIALVDIMMPDMDGYETIRNIRKDRRFRALPILALTAKAMTGDREKCLEAGASDYISKPVNTNQLLSLMRALLSG